MNHQITPETRLAYKAVKDQLAMVERALAGSFVTDVALSQADKSLWKAVNLIHATRRSLAGEMAA